MIWNYAMYFFAGYGLGTLLMNLMDIFIKAFKRLMKK